MILLTATPHSGVEESFLSLLGLIKPEFAKFDLAKMEEKERIALSQHFIQRRRADIKTWLGETTPFPDRETEEITYTLSPAYQELFKRVYEFSREIVKSGETLTGWKRRIKFWHALALLRCVMSSPAAASAALVNAAKSKSIDVEPAADESGNDDSYASLIYEPTDDAVNDAQPATIIEEGIKDLSPVEARSIGEFARVRRRSVRKRSTIRLKPVQLLSETPQRRIQPDCLVPGDCNERLCSGRTRKTTGKAYPDICIKSITRAMPDEERREKIEDSGRIHAVSSCH